jgi:hypothetical protein
VDQIDQIKILIQNYAQIFHDEKDGDLPAANLPEHEIKRDIQSPKRVTFRQIQLALKLNNQPSPKKSIQVLFDIIIIIIIVTLLSLL